MEEILRIRDPQSQEVCIKTKENNIGHCIKLTDYLDFVFSSSFYVGPVDIHDITSVGYKPKGKESLIYLELK